MWWDPQTYGFKRRQEIIITLKSQGIISESAVLEFITGNAETSNANNQFNVD